MSRVPGWLGRLGAGLTEVSERLDERRAEVEKETEPEPAAPVAVADEAPPAPRPAPTTGPRPDPAEAVPWGVRVAAEAGWRLLVLAGTVWVLMRVISAVQLVVFAFVIALLITALLQPTVARLRRYGVPRGPATAMTAILGFVIMGLMGWFVTWQVMENIDSLSNQIQSGIDDLRNWLLKSPFHVTDKQINQIAKNLREAIGANADQITSAGLEGVQVIVEALTGILLVFFSTLFLLYDGERIWQWFLKLVPAAARPGVAGAGPRAWRTLTAYVRGTVLVALIDAIFIGMGIYFLDVPMAVPLAVFIFLFSFIPLVGAVASGALAVIVALVTQGVFTAVMTLIVVLAVQQIEGHVLQPFILGRAVRVHPLAVVLTVAAGGMVAGIGGAVVAVPLVAVTNTVVGYLRQYSLEMQSRQTSAAAEETAAEPHAEDPAHQG
ncbi:putative PurR-regulated permease PerM [Streptomyces griseochromogenes]|uniref:AI-2E family transporter n=1 Tax=Streptomyces griseochromogenes TaxID=68214 RepID=A0A1B1ARH6_9ACTN|nr:AI-2E family transporter [Streptomyces griseochromogenes]ANP49188.1 AI-2E family transporter [Streptomyces griseochromogenes]MBP2049267.1 putative PurR-regulated permease PerM [Streptomyces griseochromogenes]